MANVNCDGTVRMCRAVRVTIHQRQQIVINKAQLKARGRTDGQAGTAGRRWIYFSADAKAVCESLSRRAEQSTMRALTTAVMSCY